MTDRPATPKPNTVVDFAAFKINRNEPTQAPDGVRRVQPSLLFANGTNVIKYDCPFNLPLCNGLTPESIYRVAAGDTISGEEILERMCSNFYFICLLPPKITKHHHPRISAVISTSPISLFFVGTRAGSVNRVDYKTRTETSLLRGAAKADDNAQIVQVALDEMSRLVYVMNANSEVS